MARRSGVAAICLASLLVCLLFSGLSHSAAGSWTVTADNLRLGVAGRMYSTPPLEPPWVATKQRVDITSVWWRYHMKPSQSAEVELCRASQCVPLSMARGRSDAFDGAASNEAFFFRARRLDRTATVVELTDLQLIVNHR